MHKCKGQTILEYTVVLIIILGVLIAMKDYIKRGIQGRWKAATDDFGEQYDPTSVNSNLLYSTQANSDSMITVTCSTGPSGDGTSWGQWTNRVDYSNTVETKTGSTQVGR